MTIGTMIKQGSMISHLSEEHSDAVTWEEELANAIIIQAVKDYRAALRDKKKSHQELREHKIRECEKFFRSEWFEILTKLNGELLLNRLQEEYQNESNSRSANRKIRRNHF